MEVQMKAQSLFNVSNKHSTSKAHSNNNLKTAPTNKSITRTQSKHLNSTEKSFQDERYLFINEDSISTATDQQILKYDILSKSKSNQTNKMTSKPNTQSKSVGKPSKLNKTKSIDTFSTVFGPPETTAQYTSQTNLNESKKKKAKKQKKKKSEHSFQQLNESIAENYSIQNQKDLALIKNLSNLSLNRKTIKYNSNSNSNFDNANDSSRFDSSIENINTESLRWENKLINEDEERKRIDLYKINRRKRYIEQRNKLQQANNVNEERIRFKLYDNVNENHLEEEEEEEQKVEENKNRSKSRRSNEDYISKQQTMKRYYEVESLLLNEENASDITMNREKSSYMAKQSNISDSAISSLSCNSR